MATDLRRRLLEEMSSGYPNMPPEEQWQDRLEHALSAPGDPCDADILSSFGWNCGWGSGFNALAAEVAVAAYFGRTVALCNPPHQNLSMWTVLRGPLRYCSRSELCDGVPQYDDPDTAKRPRMPWGYSAIFWGGCLDHDECDVTLTRMPKRVPAARRPGISPDFRAFSKRFRHLVYEKTYHFDSQTESQVAEAAHALLQGHQQPYVGVHIRGTDKFKEAVDVGIEPYVQRTLELANQTGASAVYLASDDAERSLEFQKLFEAQAPPGIPLLMKPLAVYPPVRGGWNFWGLTRIVFMAEVKVLVDASAFVGTASSNVGRLVYFLRPERSRGSAGPDPLDVSVDEGNDFFSRHI